MNLKKERQRWREIALKRAQAESVGRSLLRKRREGGRGRIKAGLGAKEGRQAGRSSKPARA